MNHAIPEGLTLKKIGPPNPPTSPLHGSDEEDVQPDEVNVDNTGATGAYTHFGPPYPEPPIPSSDPDGKEQ